MDDSSSLVLVLGIGGSILLSTIVIMALVIVLVTKNGGGGGGGGGGSGGGGGGSGGGTAIPIDTYPFEKNTAPWYSHDGGDSRISAKDGTLRITLVKNATGGSSGGGFKANPHKTFPATGVQFGYSVYFPDDFSWKKGGKLPGVCWGTSSSECATGSNWSTQSGSFRVMWREDGQAIGYAYLAVTGSGSKAGNTAMKDQGSQFTKMVRLNQSNKSGLDIWHTNGTKLQFKKGWNTVNMRLVMNSPGKKDGTIELTVNGTTNTVTDAQLRLSDSVKFNSANIVAFRGGNGEAWEGDTDTSLQFKNFTISRIS